MPQLAQLPLVFLSQWFWLAITLSVIYFGVGRGIVPRVEQTMDARDKRIADDLAAAEKARADADETEAAYRTRMDASRAEAGKLALAAKEAAARKTEKRLAKANAELDKKMDEAVQRIAASRSAALADVQGVAAEFAQQIVASVAGLTVDRPSAEAAVAEARASA